jgi:hypothetical protein
MSGVPLLDIHDDALPAPLFNRLWRKVRALGDERLKDSYWTTFWYDFAAPQTAVDQAVLALRDRFFPDDDSAGVEWWLGRTDLRNVPIEMHCDRDNQLHASTGRTRHPVRSSVLYFNRVKGGCLLVTDQKLSLDGERLVPETPKDYALAKPVPNRFVAFDGRLVHGVLDANNEVPHGKLNLPEGRMRYALVVNWWDRPPEGARAWTGKIYEKLRAR